MWIEITPVKKPSALSHDPSPKAAQTGQTQSSMEEIRDVDCNSAHTPQHTLSTGQETMKDCNSALEHRTYTFPSGCTYEGTFLPNGKKHGAGLWRHPSGEAYEGVFENNHRCGFGVLLFASVENPSEEEKHNVPELYLGTWAHDCMDGTGILYFSESNESLRIENEDSKPICYPALRYCGAFEKDQKHGEGICSLVEPLTHESNFELTDYYMWQRWNHDHLESSRPATLTEIIANFILEQRILSEVCPQAPRLLEEWCSRRGQNQECFATVPHTFKEPKQRMVVLDVVYPNSGAQYSGECCEVYKHGYGHWHHNTTGESYTGQFCFNYYDGWGIYRFMSQHECESASIPCQSEGSPCYVGSWRSGKMHGWGVWWFSMHREAGRSEADPSVIGETFTSDARMEQGGWYMGQYVQDQKHGFGVYCFAETVRETSDGTPSRRKLRTMKQWWSQGTIEFEKEVTDECTLKEYRMCVTLLCKQAYETCEKVQDVLEKKT